MLALEFGSLVGYPGGYSGGYSGTYSGTNSGGKSVRPFVCFRDCFIHDCLFCLPA